MSRISIIELYKESMKFSAGHFTIFSSTVRENLHGHNYNLYAGFTTRVAEEGLSFDYRFYTQKLLRICAHVDETVILPGKSHFLSITEQGDYYHAAFAKEVLIFLKRDVTILPIRNVTVEELSNWFLEQITSNREELDENKILEIKIKIFSGPGQAGLARWQREQAGRGVGEDASE